MKSVELEYEVAFVVELEVEEQDTSELAVEFVAVNAAFENEAADKEAYAHVAGVEAGPREVELGDKAEGGVGYGLVGESETESDYVAVQQVVAVAVVGELASDSEIVGLKEPEYVKVVATVPVPEAVFEVEAEIGFGAVTEIGVGAGHRPAGTVEPQTADKGSTVDTAVGMDLVRGTAGNIVDTVAADTIALQLAAQQSGRKVEFEKAG